LYADTDMPVVAAGESSRLLPQNLVTLGLVPSGDRFNHEPVYGRLGFLGGFRHGWKVVLPTSFVRWPWRSRSASTGAQRPEASTAR
jgi:hypothetical protein